MSNEFTFSHRVIHTDFRPSTYPRPANECYVVSVWLLRYGRCGLVDFATERLETITNVYTPQTTCFRNDFGRIFFFRFRTRGEALLVSFEYARAYTCRHSQMVTCTHTKFFTFSPWNVRTFLWNSQKFWQEGKQFHFFDLFVAPSRLISLPLHAQILLLYYAHYIRYILYIIYYIRYSHDITRVWSLSIYDPKHRSSC